MAFYVNGGTESAVGSIDSIPSVVKEGVQERATTAVF
jgi:hypothetical protein